MLIQPALERPLELRASGLRFAGFMLVELLLVVLTAGLWLLLVPGRVERYRIHNTYLDRRELRYESGWLESIGHAAINLLILVATLGLGAPICSWRNQRFLYRHLSLPDGRRLSFDAPLGGYYVRTLGCWLATILTLGIFAPWARSTMTGYRVRHLTLSGESVRFDGSGLGVLGHGLLSWLLCAITLQIYLPWAVFRMWRWEAENTIVPRTANDKKKQPVVV